MTLFKRGWWKITPQGVVNASGAFGVFDEIFHPQAQEITQIKEEQKRAVLQADNEGEPLKITIKLPSQE
jgi:hypothetical protein